MEHEKLYVVTAYFNPYGWKKRKQLYQEFVPYIEHSGAILITVEVGYKDHPYEVTTANNPWHLQLRTSEEMWHKERAINLGIQKLLQLDPDAKYIAWIDADVKFSNHHWVKDTIKALQLYCVVQLYSEAHNMCPNHQSMWKCPSVFFNFLSRGYHQSPPLPLKYVAKGHPGLAWAARRQTLDDLGGLIDYCVAGSADTHMANALMGDVTLFTRPGMSPGFRRALERWGERSHRYVQENVGYVKGICFHYWHGKSEQRGYEKRWDIMCHHKFDPNEDIYAEANGLYRFTWSKPHLKLDLRRSMLARNEDSVDL